MSGMADTPIQKKKKKLSYCKFLDQTHLKIKLSFFSLIFIYIREKQHHPQISSGDTADN